MRRLLFLIVLLFALAGSATAQALPPAPPPSNPPATTQADEPVTLSELQAEAKAKAEADVKTLPVLQFNKIQDVIQLRVEQDQLAVDTPLSPMEESLVVIPGLPGISKMRIANSLQAPQPTLILINFENLRFDSPDALTTQNVISYVPGRLMLHRLEGLPDDQMRNIQLIQSDQYLQDNGGRIMLYVQITGANAVDLKLFADSFTDLRRKYPLETARYLDPMFRALRQESVFARVDPKLAWQVFADAYQPTPEHLDKTKALVAQLGAESFKDREAASDTLKQLGEPAAIVLMRSDRKGLNEEQIGRIDAFLTTFKPVSEAKAATLRKDSNFLLDCLYSEDGAIRQLALAELTKVTGKPIAFDSSAGLEARIEAVAKIRESLAPTTREIGRSQ